MLWLFHKVLRVALLGAVVAALLPFGAAAHENREVAEGQFAFTVGFLDEPAFTGLKNGLSLEVVRPGGEGEEGTPVEGAFDTLQAEVIYGDQSMELPLTPAFGEAGAYRSVFFPMAEGDYTFHIFGDIEGVAIDETFTSSPEGFDSVQSPEPLQFPQESGSAITTVAFPVAVGALVLIFGGLVALIARRRGSR